MLLVLLFLMEEMLIILFGNSILLAMVSLARLGLFSLKLPCLRTLHFSWHPS